MATPRQVGAAFVEVLGDFARFRREAERELNHELRELGRHAEFKHLVQAAGDAGEDAGEEFIEEFSEQIVRGGRRNARLVSRSLREGVDEALDGVRNTSEDLFVFLRHAASGIGKGFTGLLATVGKLGPAFLVQMIALPPVIFSVILGLTGLAAQLSNILGLLGLFPGALTILIASIVPLVIAFQGFGDAIEAIIDGDPEKIKKALEGLSPAARSVAKEFQTLLPLFREIRKIVQQAFFEQITGALTRLLRVLGPALVGGLANVATAMGQLLDSFARTLATPKVADQIARIFAATGNIITVLGAGGLRLLEGFLGIIVASLPTIEKLAAEFGGFLAMIGDKLLQAIEDGSFQQWLDDALEVSGQLLTTFKLLWEFVTLLFGLTEEEGKQFLADINSALNTLNTYLKDPVVRDALKGLLQLFTLIVGQVVAIGIAFTSIALFIGFVIEKVKQLIQWFDRLAAKSNIIRAISPAITGFLPALFAEGAVVRQPTLAVVGEAGPEAVVPLNNPQRARQVMGQAGLLDMGFGTGGPPIVQVFLGTQEITDILDVRVKRALDAAGRALVHGPRAA